MKISDALFRMTRDSVASRIAADPQRPWLSVAKGWRSGLLIACVSVGVAATLRALLQNVGHFHYLPLLPAVMVVALMADRRAAAVAVALCVAVLAFRLPRVTEAETAC